MSKKPNQPIDKLTPEQEALIPKYKEMYQKIACDTSPINKPKAEAAIIALYKYRGLPAPEFEWVDDIFQGCKRAAQHANGREKVTVEEIRDQASKPTFGSYNAQWVVFYHFIFKVVGVAHEGLIDIVDDIVRECGVFWTFEDLVVCCPKPVEIHTQDGKLHNTKGMAIKYGTGEGIYALNGEYKESLMEVLLESTYSDSKKPA